MPDMNLKAIPAMRTALVAIQELHKPYRPTRATAVYCAHCFEDGGYDGALSVLYPCDTRKLADEALTDRMARTNQGENK
ncbi:hypothetical protein [Glutamicibacter sp. AOP5-A2-18]|uniref:hypothetical protein n=1 Tax=Glutamicibacter sp. AOP5-A2-18 TaxID=3457656 RepID=UPI0040337FBA